MDYANQLSALVQVLVIDLSLAGDNTLMIGMAAAGLPEHSRRRAVWLGLGAATVLRILFAIFAVRLLHITGLAIAGGLLLLWVGWKMYRDLRRAHLVPASAGETASPKKLTSAILQILLADLGMSLDNILAVAGAARDHYAVLALGLALSIGLMGFAATATAKMIHRQPWLGWLGVIMVLYVGGRMIWDGVLAISSQ